MSRSAQNAALLRRVLEPELVGVDKLVSLCGRQAAHSTNRPVDGLAAIRRQLLELLKKLARLLLLIGSQVLPGLHAAEHALLLLRGHTGKMLQLVFQPPLLLGRKPPELGIVFEGAALLGRRQIFIAAEPVSGVSGLVLRWTGFIRAAGVGTIVLGTIVILKAMPLPIRTLGRGLTCWTWASRFWANEFWANDGVSSRSAARQLAMVTRPNMIYPLNLLSRRDVYL